MCELQFIKKYNDKINHDDFIEFKKMLQFGSIQNNDAFGLFNSMTLFKKKGSIDFKGLNENSLYKDNFIIGHNRYTTKGSADFNHNNHPFKLNSFILVHNGIISNYDDLNKKYKLDHKIETDSYTILSLINHFFIKYQKSKKDLKRIHLIRKSIKKCCELLNGSYSVFLYDCISQNIFYFKNSMTEFKFILTEDNILIGSTNHLKFNYIYEDKTFNEIKIKDCKIYLINNKHKLKELDSFKELNEDRYRDYRYYKKYNNYVDDSLKGYNDFELMGENEKMSYINEVFLTYLAYVPDHEIDFKSNNIIISMYDDIADITNIFNNLLTYNDTENKFYINIDDLIENFREDFMY